jgi:hypothetical protein
MAFFHLLALLLALLAFPFGVARAAEESVVVAVEGAAEIGRGGVWTAAAAGAPIRQGDELRTGTEGRMLIAFDDGGALVLGRDSRLTIDEHSFETGEGAPRSLFHLAHGRLRALVGDAFQKAGAVYEIETPASVVSVRGTEFLVFHDEAAGASEVVGVRGEVEVYSALSWTKGAVVVKPRELTRIERGGFPSLPRALPERLFVQYLAGLDLFVGSGRRVSLLADHPLLTGRFVPPSERPSALAGPGGLGVQAPVDQPYERKNRGSVADVTRQPPIPALLPPSGGVGIDF